MTSRNTASGANSGGDTNRLGLTEVELKLANGYAEQIVEFADLSPAAEIIENVRSTVEANFPLAGRPELIAEGAYEAALNLKTERIKEEITNLGKSEIDLEKKINSRQEMALDKFARVMPRSTVNPKVVSEILDGNLKLAALGGIHKTSRAVSLRANWRPFSPSAYDLKTKEEKAINGKSSDSTDNLVEFIGDKQSEVEHGKLAKQDLIESNKEVAKLIELFKTFKPAARERLKAVSAVWKEISNSTEDIADTMEEYATMVKMIAAEESMSKGNGVNQTAGDLYGKYRKLIWTNKKHTMYVKAFEDQAVVERKLIQMETRLKLELGSDLDANPVEKNENAESTYSAASTTLLDFERRQNRLMYRIAMVEGLLKMANSEYKSLEKKVDQKISAGEKEILGYKADMKEIDKVAKKWARIEVPNLEKLFWHEFGHRVSMIREWQSKLPTIHRKGPAAYTAQTTSICKEYEAIRAEIEELEKDAKFSGLMDVLERELGMARSNPFKDNSKVSLMRKELIAVKGAIKEMEIDLINHELMLENLKKKA